jgi:hypothetical protein
MPTTASETIEKWPAESKDAAQIILERRGEPDEVTASRLTWHDASPWKRIEATEVFHEHHFPAPHIDSVECFLDYDVPVDRFSDLARYDGSVMVERTAGEISARCHDEEANFLALNLADEIVRGQKTVEEAREYYATEFVNAKRGGPTPYMDSLRFTPKVETGDPDESVLTREELDEAQSG